MAAFSSPNQFPKELAIRTQLNYFNLLLLEENDPERQVIVRRKIDDLHNRMMEQGFAAVDICCGTQLINSVLGLLVFPEQQFYNDLSTYYTRSKWNRDFRCLSQYLFCGDSNRFVFHYTFNNKCPSRPKKPEKITPKNILRHMRNAVSHKKISLYPIQDNHEGNIDEVTDIVFEDYPEVDESDESLFMLKLRKDDFETVLLEIASYFMDIDKIKERDRRERQENNNH